MLKLVHSSLAKNDQLEPEICSNESIELIWADAAAISAQIGTNSYSTFLTKHGARPSPSIATNMGLAIGFRVKASDGNIYPPITASEKATREAHAAQKRAALRATHTVDQLLEALKLIDSFVDDANGGSVDLQRIFASRAIAHSIDQAIECLNRISRFARDANDGNHHRAAESCFRNCP